MSYTYRKYRFKRYETEQKRREEETRIIDDKFLFDIKTSGIIPNFVLTNRVQPVLAIPLSYNPTRKLFEIPSGVLRDARLKAYYLSAEPSPLTVSDFDFIRMDEYRNLYVHLKARAPDTGNVVELETESEDYKNLRVIVCQESRIAPVASASEDSVPVGWYVLHTGARLYGFDGQYWQRLRCDSTFKTLLVMPYYASNYVEVTNIDSETLALSLNVERYARKTIQLKNVGSNDLDVEIRGTLYDDEDEEVIVSYFTLSPGASKVYSINDAWTYIKIYAKASASGNPSDLRIKYQLLAC